MLPRINASPSQQAQSLCEERKEGEGGSDVATAVAAANGSSVRDGALPVVDPPRRSSLNSKILLAMTSPSLDLPREELAPKSLSMKESPTKPTASKTLLTRLNRSKPSIADGMGRLSHKGSIVGDWFSKSSSGLRENDSADSADGPKRGLSADNEKGEQRGQLVGRSGSTAMLSSSNMSVTALAEVDGADKRSFTMKR